jgi:quinol monooxygenase YgiN
MIMSENIHIRAEFIIEKDNVEQYKKLIREMSNFVETNEPRTLVYQFYLNGDGTKCMVHETYVDSKAVLSHNDSTASKTILPRIFNIAKLNTLDVYGNPSNELKKLLASFNSQIFNLYTGFSRKNE